LILNRLFTGNLTEAEYFINICRGLAKSPDIGPLGLTILKELESFYYWLSGKFEKCHAASTEALNLASATGVYIMNFFVLGHGAAGVLSSGDLASAEAVLSNIARELNRAGAWERGLFHTLATWKALLLEDFAQATFHGELAVQCSQEAGFLGSDPVTHLGQALALHASGRINQAAEQLAQAFSLCYRVKSRQVEFGCHLAQAEFALDSGDEATVIDSLQKAMSLGKAQGYVNTWFWRPAVMARLCCKALEANIEVEYVQDLIRKRDLVPDEPPLEIENWPWPIKIYTLGVFALTIDGEPFSFSGRVRQKPFSLLKALIALGGKGVHEHQIHDALWPDAEGDAAYNAFSTTLHRLRKVLRSERAITVSEGKVSLDGHFCWVDAWPVERVLGQAETAWEEGERRSEFEEAVQLTEKAMAMKEGVFLPGESESWTIPFRERLKDKFLRCVKRLGSYYRAMNQHEKAIHCYSKGLEFDPFVEYFYQELMSCYGDLGLRSEALRTYQRCCDNLSEVLGVEPSGKTKSIYQSLL
jgi:DNA-binding SARP family transcriptional activator